MDGEEEFKSWFKQATGNDPYPFQTRFACDPELPSLVDVPTGMGKTAMAVLGWLTREGWIRDKGMQVLQLWSDRHRETSIDIFVHEPFPFDEEYANALIKMKEAAGREQDRIDIEHLRMRLEDDAGK